MVAEVHQNPEDFARFLAALPESDRGILDAFLNLRASISALARQYNWPIADLIAWMQRPDIRPILRGIAQSAEDALRIRTALARQTAIDTLEQAALDARTAIDQRRAGSALARACQSERAVTRARPAHAPSALRWQPVPAAPSDPSREPAGEQNPQPAATDHNASIPRQIENTFSPRQIVSILLEALADSDETGLLALETFSAPGFEITRPSSDTNGDGQTAVPVDARQAELAQLKTASPDSVTILHETGDTAVLCIIAPDAGETPGVAERQPAGKPSAAQHPRIHLHFHRAPGAPWLLTKIALLPAGP